MTDNEIVEKYYPDVYEQMHDMDMYHASEYCYWFVLGLDLQWKESQIIGKALSLRKDVS